LEPIANSGERFLFCADRGWFRVGVLYGGFGRVYLSGERLVLVWDPWVSEDLTALELHLDAVSPCSIRLVEPILCNRFVSGWIVSAFGVRRAVPSLDEGMEKGGEEFQITLSDRDADVEFCRMLRTCVAQVHSVREAMESNEQAQIRTVLPWALYDASNVELVYLCSANCARDRYGLTFLFQSLDSTSRLTATNETTTSARMTSF